VSLLNQETFERRRRSPERPSKRRLVQFCSGCGFDAHRQDQGHVDSVQAMWILRHFDPLPSKARKSLRAKLSALDSSGSSRMHRPCEAVELFIAEGTALNPAGATAGSFGIGFDTIKAFLPFLSSGVSGGRRQNNLAAVEASGFRDCRTAEPSLIFISYLARASREVCGNWRCSPDEGKKGVGNGNVEPVLRIPPLTAFTVDSPRYSECVCLAKTEV